MSQTRPTGTTPRPRRAVSYADMPGPLLSKATGVAGVAQQVARGFGVAVAAALLALIAGLAKLTAADFSAGIFTDRVDPARRRFRLFALDTR